MTTNQMIYKTLTTKVTKEPKYKSVLDDMGFTVFESGLSHYNYWAIKCNETGRTLVISRDRGNKRGLFDPYSLIKHDGKNNDILKVDFVRYLRKRKYDRTKKQSIYSELRWKIERYKSWAEYEAKRVTEAQKQVDKALEYLDYCKKEYRKNTDGLRECRSRVDELRKA